jgi:uncharacterized protein (TIGR02996 family)
MVALTGSPLDENTMTTREDLLRAIIADPDDDAPRLVYADFLEETGDLADGARADLIRSQIHAHRLPDSEPHKAAIRSRMVELWKRYKPVWFSWAKKHDSIPYPIRGFAESWHFSTIEDFETDGVPAFEREPITSVTLSIRGPDRPLARAATWPQLARLRTLNLWPGEPSEEEVPAFLSSPHLTGLRNFWYMGPQGTRAPLAEAVRLLATSPQYAGLESLTIDEAGVGNDGAFALAGSRTLTKLTTLALSHCDIRPQGLRALLASPILNGVEHLGLGGNARTAAAGQVLASILALSSRLEHLESLTLDETVITDQAAALLGQGSWSALRKLILVPHHRNDTTAQTGLPTMTVAGLEELADRWWFSRLEDLDLSGHALGDAGATALARARLTQLRRLHLMTTGLTAAGLRELVAAYADQLEHLQLYGNLLGDDGAAVLAAAAWPRMTATPEARHLERGLFLGECAIGDRGASAFLESTTIPVDIPTLFLGNVSVSPRLLAELKRKYPQAMIQL